MLLILIPIAWIALVIFFVILCQMAAHGDAAMALPVSPHHGIRATRRAFVLREDGTPRAPRSAELRPLGTVHVATRASNRSTGRGVRPRRPGCISG